MAETLADVKRRLGPDAVILNTRTFTRGGVLGRGREQVVEITAARETSALWYAPRAGGSARRTEAAAAVNGPGAPRPHRISPMANELTALSSQVAELNAAVTELLHGARRNNAASVPDECRGLYQELLQAQVADELAEDLVRRVHAELPGSDRADPNKVRQKLASFVESMLPVAPPALPKPEGGPAVLAFVGPTGVGKTTTVAKLAANYQLREGHRVGLITLDTCRIGAIEQLRTYADVIDVPLKVVRDPGEMDAALSDLRSCDFILVDTVGRSQNDRTGLAELGRMLQVAAPDEVHLLLAGTSAASVITRALERFASLGVNRVILTKLDEAVGFGVILNCLCSTKLQLSYVTTGQRVPNDIRRGGDAPLARWILDGIDAEPGTLAPAT